MTRNPSRSSIIGGVLARVYNEPYIVMRQREYIYMCMCVIHFDIWIVRLLTR